MQEIYCPKCKRVHYVSAGFAMKYSVSSCPGCSYMCDTGVARFEIKESAKYWRKNKTPRW